ncbi:GTPase of the mitochondrial inner membrane that associates with the large ribosomal subunit [Coemansia sp. RSA 2336]|nr:GTPase of the mitochondrial inner membrane that associates with the large ribosomal subunit [Coemansia sp. RSA 2336]
MHLSRPTVRSAIRTGCIRLYSQIGDAIPAATSSSAAAIADARHPTKSKLGGRNFIDYMRCTAIGGAGGNGCVSFFRDTMVANGPPNGGNGGNGGSVWLEVDDNETSLNCVKRQLKARSGANGQGKSMHGAGGKDLTVKVPKGTIVREIISEQSPTSEIPEKGFLNTLVNEIERDQREYRQSKESWFVHYPQWEDRNELSKVRLPQEFKAFKWELDHPQQLHVDLTEHGQRALVARGGLGGLGNPHFISPTERQPHYALRGLPGQRRIIELELKTIADVGLVGMPNAGKSTFLSAVSNAHPKIAPYPFTTLNPYIGTVDFRDTFQLTIADIPGLIPGAHKNIGLGHAFLRHIERSRVLVYIVDVSGEAPWNDLLALQQELDLYHKGLSSRPSLVIANKADMGELARRNFEQWQQQTSIPLIPISAKFRKNILKATHAIRQLAQ